MELTKDIGNRTEAAVLAEFLKRGISVSIPFGNSEPYDLVVHTKKGFKSIQVKHAIVKNGCVVARITKQVGYAKKKRITYDGLADYIALWCEELDSFYLLSLEECKGRIDLHLRIEPPKNNSAITTVTWADDYLFEDKVQFI